MTGAYFESDLVGYDAEYLNGFESVWHIVKLVFVEAVVVGIVDGLRELVVFVGCCKVGLVSSQLLLDLDLCQVDLRELNEKF